MLFAQRAAAVKPDFKLDAENAPTIAEICARVDGLPLAIELAAARVKMLPAARLLARLQSRLGLLTTGPRDLPERQQTLRKAIDWSYDLLDQAEQKLLRRLAVFWGGCTLEGAEAVANTANDLSVDMLDRMLSLVDESLLQQRQTGNDEPRLRNAGNDSRIWSRAAARERRRGCHETGARRLLFGAGGRRQS